jgi:hypothetical protein
MLHLTREPSATRLLGTCPGGALPGLFGRVMPQGGGGLGSPRFDDAMTLYEQCQWPEAFEQLAALADTGHPDAARIALLMAQRGTAMFGGRFDADPARRERWSRAASQSPMPLANNAADPAGAHAMDHDFESAMTGLDAAISASGWRWLALLVCLGVGAAILWPHPTVTDLPRAMLASPVPTAASPGAASEPPRAEGDVAEQSIAAYER